MTCRLSSARTQCVDITTAPLYRPHIILCPAKIFSSLTPTTKDISRQEQVVFSFMKQSWQKKISGGGFGFFNSFSLFDQDYKQEFNTGFLFCGFFVPVNLSLSRYLNLGDVSAFDQTVYIYLENKFVYKK